ncbi:MAG: Nif3-like dinuclear metal center hexameric protein [bacterium]
MVECQKIVQFLDEYLDVKNIQDDSWNGLQFQGKPDVGKIVFAVDAGVQTFQKAVEAKADMVVVHHGMFWKGASPNYVGYVRKRLNILYHNEISLYAAHLPLDKHPEVGNNAQLLKLLNFEKDRDFGLYHGQNISFMGKSDTPKSIDQIKTVLEKEIGAQCKVLPFGPSEISTIAVCSGGGANYGLLCEALGLGVDLYLTGDATEMYHFAKDVGMNVIFAGHHATEIVGVKALAQVIQEKFEVETVFVDIPTGL